MQSTEKIEPDSGKPTYIKTVLGVGYKFASGDDNRITAAHQRQPKTGNQEKVSCFLRPKPSRILHRNKIIQILLENIA